MDVLTKEMPPVFDYRLEKEREICQNMPGYSEHFSESGHSMDRRFVMQMFISEDQYLNEAIMFI